MEHPDQGQVLRPLGLGRSTLRRAKLFGGKAKDAPPEAEVPAPGLTTEPEQPQVEALPEPTPAESHNQTRNLGGQLLAVVDRRATWVAPGPRRCLAALAQRGYARGYGMGTGVTLRDPE